MLIDKKSTYADGQAVGSIGDTASTNILDEGVDHDIGVGTRLYAVAAIQGEQFVGSGTMRVHLETSDTADFSTTHRIQSSEYKDAATMNADGVFCKMLVPAGMRRYSRMVFDVATSAFTAGKVFGGLVLSVDNVRNYPDRLSITGR